MGILTSLLLDAGAITVGSLTGNMLKRHIRRDVLDGVMVGIGAVILYIGATGIRADTNALTLLIAFAAGSFLGFALDLEKRLGSASAVLEKWTRSGDGRIIGPGMDFFIVSCSGAYAMNACFFAGMGDFSFFYTKIGLDLVVSLAMSSTLGIGVVFSIVPISLFQGLLMLFSGALSALMSPAMVSAFASAGSLVAAMIGTNMLGATKIKVINFIPAVVFAPFAALLVELLPL